MDDDFATSTVAVLSSLNYFHDGPCRNYLSQVLKSPCTVNFLRFSFERISSRFLGASNLRNETSSSYSSNKSGRFWSMGFDVSFGSTFR